MEDSKKNSPALLKCLTHENDFMRKTVPYPYLLFRMLNNTSLCPKDRFYLCFLDIDATALLMPDNVHDIDSIASSVWDGYMRSWKEPLPPIPTVFPNMKVSLDAFLSKHGLKSRDIVIDSYGFIKPVIEDSTKVSHKALELTYFDLKILKKTQKTTGKSISEIIMSKLLACPTFS